jgi:hypothetical protein
LIQGSWWDINENESSLPAKAFCSLSMKSSEAFCERVTFLAFDWYYVVSIYHYGLPVLVEQSIKLQDAIRNKT